MSASVLSLLRSLDRKERRCVELVREYLDRIESKNTSLNAFISTSPELALRRAAEEDEKRKRGEAGALSGIPFAVKDNICVSGIRTTCGSEMLRNFVSPYTATAVQRLTDKGAIFIGKTNMDEFGMGSSTDTSVFGPVKNPLDLCRTAGGSSGGSAAALASDMCAFSLGSDTGGSSRQPAAFCGLVSIKPTYGTVSRYGLVAFASSLEQICPLSTSVEDSALLLEAMGGKDERDATTLDRQLSVTLDTALSDMRIGVPSASLCGVSSATAAALRSTADALRERGANIVEISLPDTELALAAYYVISSAEASSNLARYDGVRYGHRSSSPTDVGALFTASRTEGFGEEVKRRILLGSFCLSHDGRESYYKNALAAKDFLRECYSQVLAECDCILMPMTPDVAPRADQKSDRPLDVWCEDRLCVSANLTGLPSLTVPSGFKDNGMPIGVQLIGRAQDEQTLYSVGYAIEKARCRE